MTEHLPYNVAACNIKEGRMLLKLPTSIHSLPQVFKPHPTALANSQGYVLSNFLKCILTTKGKILASGHRSPCLSCAHVPSHHSSTCCALMLSEDLHLSLWCTPRGPFTSSTWCNSHTIGWMPVLSICTCYWYPSPQALWHLTSWKLIHWCGQILPLIGCSCSS